MSLCPTDCCVMAQRPLCVKVSFSFVPLVLVEKVCSPKFRALMAAPRSIHSDPTGVLAASFVLVPLSRTSSGSVCVRPVHSYVGTYIYYIYMYCIRFFGKCCHMHILRVYL